MRRVERTHTLRGVKIHLIVGSESGNAEMVGDCVKDALDARGHDVSTYQAGDEVDLARVGVVLVVCSTTGLGEIPQNVAPLFAGLEASRPDLGAVRYGVIGMGDRNYKDTYCGGPKKWDALLTALGATRVGDRLELDATDHPCPDQDAVAWLDGWLGALG